MNILIVIGTRPEAYKMIPLILEMKNHPEINCKLCISAQHRELVDEALSLFNIAPDFDLDVMTHGQTLTEVVTRVLTGLEPLLNELKPDVLFVHGDTATTVAASLAAFYAGVKVGHVEAGLRSFDKYQPFPEEINRKLATVVADLHFAPTATSRDNLLKENTPAETITITGNTAIDLIKYTKRNTFSFADAKKIDFTKRVILLTAHRAENRGKPMENICRAVLRIVNEFEDSFVVWPVHPSHTSQEPARKFLSNHPQILLTEAVNVIDMHNLMKRAYLLLTDSGGLQEEAPSFDLPVIVLREVTERPEGVDAGVLLIGGTTEEIIYKSTKELLTDGEKYGKMQKAANPYGDGRACERIIDFTLRRLSCCH